MMSKLQAYLADRRLTEETCKGHLGRANIIINEKEGFWERDEALAWVDERAQERDYTESTINKWHQTFNHLHRCFGWEWAKLLPRLKEHNKAPPMLSLEQMLEFYKLHTEPKWDLIVRLAISTGARPSEILKLKGEDVDLDRAVINLHHTKTGRDRLLIVQNFLIDELRQYVKDNQIKPDQLLFFYRNRYKRLSEQAYIKECDRRLAILHIDKKVRPYAMRHSFITRIASEVNMLLTMELAGHTLTETTLRYIHNNEYALRKASEKDFLFDPIRDFSVRVQKIVKAIDELVDIPSLNQVKLSEARLCLLQAVQPTPDFAETTLAAAVQ